MFGLFISSIRCLGGRQFLNGQRVTNSAVSLLVSHGLQPTKGIGKSSSS